jgi:hypothetical protein
MVPVSGWQHSGVHRVAYPRTGYAIVGKRLAVCNRLLTSCETSTIRFVVLLPRVCDSKGSATRLTLRDLHRDSARPCHICTGTGLSPCHICTGTRFTPAAHIRTGTAGQVSGVSRSLKQSSGLYEHFTAQLEQSHPGVRPVPVQVWQGCPSADVAGVSPFPVQQRCGSGALVQSVSDRAPSRWQSYTRFSRF